MVDICLVWFMSKELVDKRNTENEEKLVVVPPTQDKHNSTALF